MALAGVRGSLCTKRLGSLWCWKEEKQKLLYKGGGLRTSLGSRRAASLKYLHAPWQAWNSSGVKPVLRMLSGCFTGAGQEASPE